MGTLGGSLLGNMLVGKGIVKSGYSNKKLKQGQGIVGSGYDSKMDL